eukprot:9228554-Karenia_brevis.AAC.1
MESICDRASCDAPSAQTVLAFSCQICAAQFASQRALESHRRAKHGDRLGIRLYVPSAECPCCGTNFRQRLRCLAHLSDRRGPKCREWVMANCPPMSAADGARLDAIDTELRRTAQRARRGHHIARLPAMHPDGSIVGQ